MDVLNRWAVGLTALLLTQAVSGFFEHQPKLFTESGNLIIESALNSNITVRILGDGVFKMNDISLSALTADLAATGDGARRRRLITQRVDTLELDLRSIQEHFEGNASIIARLIRVENRSLSSGNGNQLAAAARLRALLRRVVRLEARLNTFATRFETDNCGSNPCQNGGTCRNELGRFACTCPANFEGPTCTQDRNECAAFAGTDLGCQNGATCENTYGAYQCVCAPGWKGVDCTRRSVDCLAGPPGELCGHGACVQTNDARGYTCVCEQGWMTDGRSVACTVDVDECADERPHCSMDPPVRCVNLPGTYTCGQCPAGYTGNGHYCVDVDECATANGGCSTTPLVRCVNTRGAHHCAECPAGWQGDGRSCTRNPAPPASSHIPDFPSSPITSCPPGYCHPLATCRRSIFGMNRCECPAGYVGTGLGLRGCRPIGEAFDPCSLAICLNGGTCVPINGTQFNCLCRPGFRQPLCMRDASHPCFLNPCKNGGTCQPSAMAVSANSTFAESMYSCRCPATHTGQHCDAEVRVCGGVLDSAAGVLKYPRTEGQYQHNQRCAWLIQTNVTQVLNVTFTKFMLEPSAQCRYDWLQLHDGPSSSAYMIGRFCGGSLPLDGNLVTTHNSLYMWFRSDNSSTHDGFELEWNSIEPVCGGPITIESFGTITSPGSPGNYPQNRDCEWHLRAPPGKRIELHFFAMQLETHAACDADFVAVYDGESTDDRQLVRYCNTSHPEPLTSSGSALVVHFHSDGIGTDTGFQIHYSAIEGIPGCGGTWTAASGELTSPKQDGRYLRNLQCEYRIRVPADSRIQVTFVEFDFEYDVGCEFDSVSIYEGGSSASPLVERYCGQTMPPVYQSQSNVLTIAMRTDWSIAGEGFRLRYEVLCGTRFVDPSGIVTSPMYPKRYERSALCTYEIVAPPGKAVVLDFIDFDIEDTDSACSFDVLAVYDGHRGVGIQPQQRLCGTAMPPQIISTTNVLTLELRTDSSIQGRGFKANYTFADAACGGVIKALGHAISPPRSEGTYDRGANCTWLIVAPPNQVVQLAFSAFDLEHGGTTCWFDYVLVMEGTMQSGGQIGKFCGTSMPPVERTVGNVMTVQFVSDGSVQRDGFAATYDFLDARNFCGGRYHAPTGKIRSPGWPGHYPRGQNCSYTIIAPVGQQIEVNVNAFELESQYQCYDTMDYLEFRNGESASSPLIGRFCSDKIPKTIRSQANRLFIHFKSDYSISGKGFELQYDSALTGCGGHLNGVNVGSVTSPNYPAPYDEDVVCEWRISASLGSTIQLDFTDMDLEDQSNCYFDVVEIFEGHNSGGKPLGRYCGTRIPASIITTGNEVYIRMRSDVSNQGRGFDLRFKTHCTRTLTDLHGVIQSPNNPEHYPDNTDCKWTILAPRGNTIQLIFSEFALEAYNSHSSDTCHFDYLDVQQLDAQSTVVEHQVHCARMPPPLVTFTNHVLLHFVSDSSFGEAGFRLEYSVVGCGDVLRAPSGAFASPRYPHGYTGNMECRWDIEVPFGNLIELTLHDYDVRMTPNCTADGVLVANVQNVSAAAVLAAGMDNATHRYCGERGADKEHKADVITSHTNRLYVWFYASGDYSGRGFNATYRQIPIQCGGQFTGIRGNIKSPNYPRNYPDNTYCEWLIEVEEAHTVQLAFPDFSVEVYDGNPCIHDYVALFSGPSIDENRRIALLCGHDVAANTTYTSAGSNQMLLVMSTDFSINMRGFQANYWASCGGRINVTDAGGLITSDTVYRYDQLACDWTFQASEPDQRIVLTFLEYYSSPAAGAEENCENSIHIRDAPEERTDRPPAFNSTDRMCASDAHREPYVSAANTVSMHVARGHRATPDTFRFRVQYDLVTAGCNRRFHSKGGRIASPGFPGTYPLNTDCEWSIEASHGNRLQLTFSAMDIDATEHCNEAYVEVRERNAQGALLGTFCGSEVPETLRAPGLWLKFHSGNEETGRGFQASYAYENLIESRGIEGQIESPLYPSYDVRTRSQQYRILSDVGTVIAVKINRLLNRGGASLTFYDGYDEQSTQLAQYTAHPGSLAESITTNTNALFIVWTAPTEGLFQLAWTAHDSTALAAANAPAHNVTLNCTESALVRIDLHETVNITSPGYPYGYDAGLECLWTLVAARPGYHVVLFFDTVDLDDSANCASDAVSLLTGDDVSGPFQEVARYCTPSSNASIHQLVHGNALQLRFTSDYYGNRTGFAATARVYCGGKLGGARGTIARNMTLSEMYGLTCDWTVTVREGRTIRLQLRRLQLRRDAQTQNCDSFLMLRNGHSRSSPYLGMGRYCGTAAPDGWLETSGNVAVVQFTKGTRFMSDDFVLDYEEVGTECGGTYTLPNTTAVQLVQSPNYPNIPNAFSECVWTVRAPHGELLRIDFVDSFELTAERPCVQELIELRDGATEAAPLIGRYCDQKPSTLHTTANAVRMRFFTQAKLPKNGFRARVAVDTCGGSFREPSGYISSPGFPTYMQLPANTQCDYRIHARPGSTVNISFADFTIGGAGWYFPDEDDDENNSTACMSLDTLTVFHVQRGSERNEEPQQPASGGDAAETLIPIGQYCGTEVPENIITQASEIMVRFTVRSRPHTLNQASVSGFRVFYNTSVERCGGDINAEAGLISSPGYPVGRSMRQFCEWRITVPKGRRVRIDVMDFDLLETPAARLPNGRTMAYGHRLNFYNDFSYASRIRTLSGLDRPDPIYSTDNRLLINLFTRSNTGHRGFRLNFTSGELAACEGDLNADAVGLIRSPANLTAFSCTYQRAVDRPFVRSAAGASGSAGNRTVGTLALDIRTVENAPAVGTCSAGLSLPLKVMHAGRDLFTAKRRCTSNGTETRYATVATPFVQTVVQARQSLWLKSYAIDYRIYDCGGTVADREAYTVRAPAVSASVQAGQPVHCAWQFSARPGVRIKVSMQFAGIDCAAEHVNIFNGPYATAPLVERVCGSDAGQRNFSAVISGEQLLIEFHTEAYRPNATEFRLLVETNFELCGGLLTAPQFHFHSPRNGSAAAAPYPNGMECVWELRARRGYHVGLAFRNRFFVEQSANCTKDAVVVRDGSAAADAAPLATLCGRTVPAALNATGRRMLVTMRTDAQIAGDGFEAVWQENCGGTFTVSSALPEDLYSPNYPDNYERLAFCNYTLISAVADQFITVDVVDFMLEDSVRGCIYDNLTVYRTADWTRGPANVLVGSYCREGSLRRLRFKNAIQLVFRSDQWLARRGFHLRYALDNCGGTIDNTTMIRLPRNAETGDYETEMSCVWNITAPENQKIVVRFEHFSTSPGDYCYQGYVELFEGAEAKIDHRKAQLCGNLTRHLPVVNLNANRGVLSLTSYRGPNGFEALVLFVRKCDVNVELTEAQPTYELRNVFAAYEPNLDCHYKVTAPEGWTIRTVFTEFHVAPCAMPSNRSSSAAADQCHCDFVQVRDGAGEFAEPIGRNRCGYNVPGMVRSTGASLWLRFVTDSEVSSTGFVAAFSLERSVCGPSVIELNDTHTLSWPLGGGKYLPNERCQWTFTVPYGQNIELSFDRLDIAEDVDNVHACDNDYLEVLDDGHQDFVLEGLQSGTIFNGGKAQRTAPSFMNNKHFATAPHRYCGTGARPTDYISEANIVHVRFRSDASVERTGFTITAKPLVACQRNYTALSGRIFSKNLRTCDTHITVPANYTIALYFPGFSIYPQEADFKCSESTAPLKILDGTRLARWECTGQPDPFFSNSSAVTLRWTNIGVSEWTSFVYDITYVASDAGRGCGGEIYNYAGQISSPLYPANERTLRVCEWHLTVPPNMAVSVQFAIFDMGPRSTCADNYVEFVAVANSATAAAVPVGNGTSTTTAVEEAAFRHFCGTDKPAIFTVPTNRVIVRSKNTVNFAGSGWLLNFMAVEPNSLLPTD